MAVDGVPLPAVLGVEEAVGEAPRRTQKHQRPGGAQLRPRPPLLRRRAAVVVGVPLLRRLRAAAGERLRRRIRARVLAAGEIHRARLADEVAVEVAEVRRGAPLRTKVGVPRERVAVDEGLEEVHAAVVVVVVVVTGAWEDEAEEAVVGVAAVVMREAAVGEEEVHAVVVDEAAEAAGVNLPLAVDSVVEDGVRLLLEVQVEEVRKLLLQAEEAGAEPSKEGKSGQPQLRASRRPRRKSIPSPSPQLRSKSTESRSLWVNASWSQVWQTRPPGSRSRTTCAKRPSASGPSGSAVAAALSSLALPRKPPRRSASCRAPS